MENSSLQTQSKDLSFISKEQIEKYAKVDSQVAELLSSKLTGIALTFAKVTIVETIESVLSEDFMKKVMNLKGKEYGFKTDERVGENYSEAKVKNCIVQAMMYGAEITGNEFNILGGNCYLTKNFCKNWLRKNKIPYKLLPSLSKKTDSGNWVIHMEIEWVDFEGNSHKEKTDILVNKFEKTSESTLRGQAERDGMAYIIEELRKESLPINKNEDFIDAIEIKDKPKFHAEPTYNENVKPEVKSDIKPEIQVDLKPEIQVDLKPEIQTDIKPDAEMVAPETQFAFDEFIYNKKKVTDIQTLTNRAKAFCADRGITVKQLNLNIYNDIKFQIENKQWN